MEIFTHGDHTIIYSEAIAVLKHHIADNSIDLIFADPPYNIGKQFANTKDQWTSDQEYLQWYYQWLELCIKKLKPHGSMYIMAATQYMPYIDIFLRDKMVILSRIIWHYDSSGVQAKKYFGSLYEPILFAVKDKNNYTFNADDIKIEAKTGSVRKLIDYRKAIPTPYNSQKVPGNVWNIPRVRYKMSEYENHPTQKPEILLERIIKASSNEGDVILDPFSGTFTTSVVAQKLQRKSIGIEIAEEYVKIGLKRLNFLNQESDLMTKINQEQKNNHQLSLEL
jgi:adenine-specific DNA-methyltransferase